MLVEVGEARDRANEVRRLVHHDDSRSAKARLHIAQRVKVHEDGVADLLGNHRHGRTARNDRLQISPAAAYAAAMLFDQRLQRDRHLFFNVARPLDVA